MTTTVAVKLQFPAGHRILGLFGAGTKCRNIHGHTWYTTWTFAQEETWPPPIEFGALKAVLNEILSTGLSHTFFVDASDPFLDYLRAEGLRYTITEGPPTTERIAHTLATIATERFPDATLLSVLVEEGPENSATWHARTHFI